MIVRIERDRVRRRVMQCTQEQRVGGDLDPLWNEARSHLRVIQQRRQKPRIDLARITAAGSAMEPAGVGVVDHARAVSGQQDKLREVGRQRHGP